MALGREIVGRSGELGKIHKYSELNSAAIAGEVTGASIFRSTEDGGLPI
jgi:hypothetical protein